MGNWIRVSLLGVLLALSVELGSYAHAQNVEWQKGDEIGLIAVCVDLPVTKVIAEQAMQSLEAAMEAIGTAIERGRCAVFPSKYNFTLKEHQFGFVDYEGDDIEVWSLTSPLSDNIFYYWLLSGYSTRKGLGV